MLDFCLLLSIFLQPSSYPNWNGVVDWELQISKDYVENIGKVRLGPHSYSFEQLFSSQATPVFQELLAKLAFKASHLEWIFNLEHRLSTKETTNRLQILLPNWIDFAAFAVHQKNTDNQVLEAGLTYDEIDLGTKLDLTKNDSGYQGNFLARWGPVEDSEKNIVMDFQLMNKQLNEYYVEANLNIPGLDTLSATGDMALSVQRSFMDMKCEMGESKHEINLEVEAHGSGRKIVGAYVSGSTSYSFNVLTRYDVVKSIHAEFNMDKIYSLNAVVSTSWPKLLFITFLFILGLGNKKQ